MIGKLHSKNVREVYNKKVVRLTIDVPYSAVSDSSIGDVDALAYLDQRVGKETGVRFTSLEEEGQERID